MLYRILLFTGCLLFNISTYALVLTDTTGKEHVVDVETTFSENGKLLPNGHYSLPNGLKIVIKDGKIDKDATKSLLSPSSNGVKDGQNFMLPKTAP